MTCGDGILNRLRGPSRRSRRSLRRNDLGEAVIEFAIVALPLLIVTFMVVQAVLVYYARVNALAAATQGANAARAYGSTTTIGHDKATQFLDTNNFGITGHNVTVASNGLTVTVTVNAAVVSLIPLMTFSVTHSAGGPIERFVS
jgi:Flp pilus assembly protein TadG